MISVEIELSSCAWRNPMDLLINFAKRNLKPEAYFAKYFFAEGLSQPKFISRRPTSFWAYTQKEVLTNKFFLFWLNFFINEKTWETPVFSAWFYWPVSCSVISACTYLQNLPDNTPIPWMTLFRYATVRFKYTYNAFDMVKIDFATSDAEFNRRLFPSKNAQRNWVAWVEWVWRWGADGSDPLTFFLVIAIHQDGECVGTGFQQPFSSAKIGVN